MGDRVPPAGSRPGPARRRFGLGGWGAGGAELGDGLEYAGFTIYDRDGLELINNTFTIYNLQLAEPGIN